MAKPRVSDLLRDGRLERVSPDINAARERVMEAKVHLESSEKLANSDPVLAYLAIYDAARKAITAHMQANGYRVTNRAGAHQAVGLYAEVTLTAPAAVAHVKAFDRMRQIRNRSEYDQQPISQHLIRTDRQHASEIVAAVEAALPPVPPTTAAPSADR
jgi:hypothetical protein